MIESALIDAIYALYEKPMPNLQTPVIKIIEELHEMVDENRQENRLNEIRDSVTDDDC